ncbi:MAG: hypothetical protein WCC60_03425 [Ilumatobacteraceae bacterium]
MELDRSAVDRVLRRASDLTASAPETASHAISEEALLVAAAEVGLDPAVVRVSLAIERLGPVARPSRADRIIGADEVVVERLLALDADEAIERLDDLMVREHQLRTRRTRPTSREWHKRSGAVGAVQRAAKSVTGDAGLSKVARVQATSSAVDDERSVLRVVADRRGQRAGMAAAGAVVGGIGLTAATVAGLLVSPLLLVTTPVAVGAAAGVARIGRRQALALAVEIDAVLDAVEQGIAPVSITQSLRRAVSGTRSTGRPGAGAARSG